MEPRRARGGRGSGHHGHLDPLDCAPSGPVATLAIDATSDQTVFYEGGSIVGLGAPPYPGAIASADAAAARNGCLLGVGVPGAPRDLDSDVPGAETLVDRYVDCAARTERWTIVGGGHLPTPTPHAAADVIEWLASLP